MSEAAQQPAIDPRPIPDGMRRLPSGKLVFAKGNKGGTGYPHQKAVQDLKLVVMRETTPTVMRRMWRKLIEAADAGNIAALKEFFDRVLGKADQPITVTGILGHQMEVKFDFSELTDDEIVKIQHILDNRASSGLQPRLEAPGRN